MTKIWIYLYFPPGNCPVYNTNAKKMDSKKCFGSNCPPLVYKSDDVYKCMHFLKSLTDKSWEFMFIMTIETKYFRRSNK